jgi:hypothetical protein
MIPALALSLALAVAAHLRRTQRAAIMELLWALGMLMAGAATPARAHGVVGQRFFPATLAIDDPFVADELSLPTASVARQHATEEEAAGVETQFSAELSKRLSPNLGLSLGGAVLMTAPEDGPTIAGFDNMEIGVKYVFLKSAEHELIVAGGLDIDVGGTGQARVGAESFSTFTPSLFFGEGLGDLPDSLSYLKPAAVTGVLGLALPVHMDPRVFQWGFTLQYNLQYLQSYVRDVGLPAPFNRMIPLVEFAMETSVEGRSRTTGTISPGIIWFGRYVQLGFEALIPINGNSLDPMEEARQNGVGFLGQIHFYLDDIWPEVFTWTPFSGVLGPTQP